MFCTNCGNKLNIDDNFCSKCGKEVSNNTNSKNTQNENNKGGNNAIHNENVPLNKSIKRIIDPTYIYWAIGLLIGYWIISAMFAPQYGDGSPFLLVVSAFIIDVFVIYKLKTRNRDTQEIFILIACCTFIALLFYGVTIDDARFALFIAMFSTFANLIISYVALLTIKKYEDNQKNNE